jgi:hypothetical protein
MSVSATSKSLLIQSESNTYLSSLSPLHSVDKCFRYTLPIAITNYTCTLYSYLLSSNTVPPLPTKTLCFSSVCASSKMFTRTMSCMLSTPSIVSYTNCLANKHFKPGNNHQEECKNKVRTNSGSLHKYESLRVPVLYP